METFISTLIVFLTPIVVEGVKKLNIKISKTKMPSWAIPILAIAVGFVSNLVPVLMNVYPGNIWAGAILGLAGVGIRELKVNFSKNEKEIQKAPTEMD